MTTTARLSLSFLLLTANSGGNNGKFSVRIPAVQAFYAPQSSVREASFVTSHPGGRSSPTQRREVHQQQLQSPVIDTTIPLYSSSDDDSYSVSTTSTVDSYASKKLLLPIIAFLGLSLATLAAFTDHLPGPPIDATAPPPFFATLPYGVMFGGSYDPYAPSLIFRDLLSTVLCIAGASAFVKGVTYPASIGYIESRDARKIIHTFSVPLFLFLWPAYSHAFGARVFASIVPLLNAVRLFLAGSSDTDSDGGPETELAGAISRSGDAKEALGGPFIYVLVMLISTLFFWTDSPIGVVSMATMALGDGLADLIGRRFGSGNKWSFNSSKSMAGSAAFVAGSFVGSLGLITWLTSMGAMDPLALGTLGLVGRLFAIAVICAGVELIPIGDDNWTVPLAAALLSAFLLN